MGMAVDIEEADIRHLGVITVDFPLRGDVDLVVASRMMKHILAEQWPDQSRWDQSVYVVRVRGPVAIGYPNGVSPVLYVGEGNAYLRLQTHAATWLTELAVSIRQMTMEFDVLEVARSDQPELHKNIGADLIRWFFEQNGSLPWFNRRRERSKESQFGYTDGAYKTLNALISVGSGNKFLWEIKPTKNNSSWKSYQAGAAKST